ncbi:hypothetical protein NKG94_07315 [Micromonospora sp. M12]
MAAWSGATLLVIGLAAIAFGVAVTARSAQALTSALCLLAGLLIGSSLIVVGMQRWLSGKGIPAILGIISIAVAVAAWILFKVTGMTGGEAHSLLDSRAAFFSPTSGQSRLQGRTVDGDGVADTTSKHAQKPSLPR